ncbi:MAG: hypothetical protein IT371_31845 [Deltaproteobacteria bacterium]|nr:hypothetical protein [Deltaproteobacteria bacterium]
MRHAWLVLLLLGFVGCVRTSVQNGDALAPGPDGPLPIDAGFVDGQRPPDGPPDGTPGSGESIVPPPDGGASRDRAVRDGPRADLRRADARPDLLRADSRPDSAPPCGPPPTVNVAPSCAQQNGQCASMAAQDGDCDGLLRSADPWPTRCDTLAVANDFHADGPSPTLFTLGGSHQWSCGQVTLAAGSSLIYKQLPPTLTNGNYLVEAKVTLGATTNPTDWAVSLRAALSGTQARVCELWQSSTYNPRPTLHSYLGFASGGSTGTWNTSAVLPATPGTVLLLQSYYGASGHVCRLLSADGSVLHLSLSHGGSAMTAGTAGFSVAGRSVTLDYLRIFAVP